ncbi:phosphotransferase [Microbacterium oxydans]|uniref:Phosphotransferase enzyme family protein n=1 Tax=Microbacterium oxydans TaxID=82380 RepID=A0A0F0L3M8_9MICO|nr:phosphotransferase [Microbacterium oxydans]KJL27738.1 Phosphotransferase enzyme family protein [Microbacterium oxydans]
MQQEIPLSGGNASAGVVRVGETVRKPWTEHSPGVLDYMRILRARGIDLPAPLGQDSQGRMMTEFVVGPLAMHDAPLTGLQFARVGAMVRAIHDASRGLDADALGLGPALIPVAGADLVCHGDLTPWNLLTGERWVFIDWDGAAASTRVWDLAYSAQAFTLNDATSDPDRAAEDLQAFVRGYEADAALRTELADVLSRRAWAMHDLLETAHRDGREPWGSMYTDFHGAHWRGVARYLDEHAAIWAHALATL